MHRFVLFSLGLLFIACNDDSKKEIKNDETTSDIKLIVLGTTQDAGSPQVACRKSCCKDLFSKPDASRMVVSLGLIDEKNEQSWIFEATPNLPRQLKILKNNTSFDRDETPDGVFLTHAHIGHYSGLMYLGREAMSSDSIPVFAMPRMQSFLENNGPWNQLIELGNIKINTLSDRKKIHLTNQLAVTPISVPHRDEYSETVGYFVEGPNKSALFIPDIDKWNKWDESIVDWVKKVDYAFLDATFYNGNELGGRDMSQIPHPSVEESMNTFENLRDTEKSKIHFIHFNHTNPLLNDQSHEYKNVMQQGYNISQFNDHFFL